MRIKFGKGEQRKFLKKVLGEINCVSLRSLKERGIDVPYSTMKNYFVEVRLLPEELFKDLCSLARIDSSEINFELVDENWGQVKGGKN